MCLCCFKKHPRNNNKFTILKINNSPTKKIESDNNLPNKIEPMKIESDNNSFIKEDFYKKDISFKLEEWNICE